MISPKVEFGGFADKIFLHLTLKSVNFVKMKTIAYFEVL